jgi:hypothetical protein
MKKLTLALSLLVAVGSAFAQDVVVERKHLGSGQPDMEGVENAAKWDNDIYHAPQYMPGYPTASPLYPRIIDVPCTKTATGLQCNGYTWLPELGRGEYLMIRPVVTVEDKPQVVTNTIVVVPGPITYVEVPVKPKAE